MALAPASLTTSRSSRQQEANVASHAAQSVTYPNEPSGPFVRELDIAARPAREHAAQFSQRPAGGGKPMRKSRPRHPRQSMQEGFRLSKAMMQAPEVRQGRSRLRNDVREHKLWRVPTFPASMADSKKHFGVLTGAQFLRAATDQDGGLD